MIKNFIKRHWKGELSLPVSYWLIGAVLGTCLFLAAEVLANIVDSFTPSLTYNSWSVLLVYPATWISTLWIYVGIWNSSTNYIAAGKSKVWGYLARFGVISGSLQTLMLVTTLHIPLMVWMEPFLLGSDPLGTVKYEILDSGRTLYISGVFGNGASSLLTNVLEENPTIGRLNLSSDGGRLKEVMRLSKKIQERKLETYVEEQCLSACTLVFLAGTPRYSTPNARIGFHTPVFTGDNRIDSGFIESAKNLYRSFNLPEAFVRKIFATPNEAMWYPSHRELIDSGIVTDSTPGGESNRLSTLSIESTDDLRKMLLSHPLWQRYESKFPGVIDEISTRMFAAIRRGESDANVMTESRKYIGPYAIRAIAKSTPEIRARFIALSVDQTRHVATLGPKFCGAFLASRLDVTKTLPKALVEREIALTQEALETDFVPPLNYSNKLFEQYLVNALTGMTAEQISAVTVPTATPTQVTCIGIVNFYKGISTLPASQRDIVTFGILSQ